MTSPVLSVRRLRDLTVVDQADGTSWVIACDSVGSIGPKPADVYPADARTVAHFAARVPLIEVLAAGATPQVIVDTLCVELDPTGIEMIEEVRAIAAELGLDADRVTGSTEDNVPSVSTGIGVTVLATIATAELGQSNADTGSRVLCLGRPTSAPTDRVEIGDPRMISFATLAAVRKVGGVGDALPVGSKGVGHEAELLAQTHGLTWQQAKHDVDLEHSGGPASCVLVAVRPDAVNAVLDLLPADLPRADIGLLA